MDTGPESLLEAMQRPSFYDHPVEQVERIETHISWIFLAGPFAYKVKKPLDLGFLDFSTLGKRRFYCDEELRLNRRFAPELYLDVVVIGRQGNRFLLGSGAAVEYAVKMWRFDREMEFDRMLEAGRLKPAHLRRLAEKIALIHQDVPVWPEGEDYDVGSMIFGPIDENFKQLRPLINEETAVHRLDALEQWSRVRFHSLLPFLKRRQRDGFVRECHGDFHLANLAWLDDKPVIFDCIEFSRSLRWIDAVNDISFLLMDLDDRECSRLGWSFLNHYLRQSGDYGGMTLLTFYKVYRAMVRAKVLYLQREQRGGQDSESSEIETRARSYIDLAARYTDETRPHLFITHGYSGSGKTTFVERLATLLPAIVIHSDVERKRLSGMTPLEKSESGIGRDLYEASCTRKTYDRLKKLAGEMLQAGFNVILDATFLRFDQRQPMRDLSEAMNLPFAILDFRVGIDELKRRLESRLKQKSTWSEATAEVLEYQLDHSDALKEGEAAIVGIEPDTSPETVAGKLATSGRLPMKNNL